MENGIIDNNLLKQSCDSLSGIGKALAGKLAQCGILTIQDLLFHLPFRYQDKTRVTPIQDLRPNDWCVVSGRVSKTEIKYGRRMSMYCYVEDKTGILGLRFFHFNKQQVKNLNESVQIRVFGEVRDFGNTLQMVHPEYQLFSDEKPFKVEETLTPIYPSTQGLSQTRLRQIIKQALTNYQDELHSLEWMKDCDLSKYNFQPIASALLNLHNPPPDLILEELENGSHRGLQRVAFDELLAQRLSMQFAKQDRAKLQANPMPENSDLLTKFLNSLPFALTKAQQRVHQEIKSDLELSKPMLRLVQGDVGSGKTVIAAIAAIQVISNGYQVALMAPTDILSEQHANTISAWCEPLGIKVRRLSGKMKAKERRETLNALKEHDCQLIIGTHALFQTGVDFAKLGLIIIDEQHRFGVEQRALLQQKGQADNIYPHQLLMTATPIPRTLAMTGFSHLDLSAIDEMPPGRTPVKTAVITQEKEHLIIERLMLAIGSGRQAYWVCTLIEESENLQCIAATNRSEELQQLLPNAKIGLIHGRMKSAEKEKIMALFKQGEIDLLVATTVIEVGVDVANASLMIIENAERLGLSQLHQLRGRVGRGSAESHCILLYQHPLSMQSRERLQVMRDTCDGFIIAEKDLALRGYGEFLGRQQTGYQKFKVASLQRDQELLSKVTETASRLIKTDPSISKAIAKRWLGDSFRFITS
ncbi:MAG: ATP-dependent DNA helicase RecG [Legionellaceae bacterium]|nr:ATP-dependent DNA helicase RecG [Legionellaceae bacterium]